MSREAIKGIQGCCRDPDNYPGLYSLCANECNTTYCFNNLFLTTWPSPAISSRYTPAGSVFMFSCVV